MTGFGYKQSNYLFIGINYQIKYTQKSMQFQTPQLIRSLGQQNEPSYSQSQFLKPLSHQERRPTPRSSPNLTQKDSEFRNFAKHYARTIKNIIKQNKDTWSWDQLTQLIAEQIVHSIQKQQHPPKKMIDTIFSWKTKVKYFRQVGFGTLIDKFTSDEIICSCEKIKGQVLSYVKREDSDLKIGKRINNPLLFKQYIKKVTKEYENGNRFSYRLRPAISRQIRQGVIRGQNLERQQIAVQQHEFSEKFAQFQSNFLL